MTRPRKGEVVHGMGAHIRRLRSAGGLTQEALAEASGLKVETISRIETGTNSPDLDTLRRLAGVFAIDIVAMFPSSPELEGGELDAASASALMARWRRLGESDRLLVMRLLDRLLSADAAT